MGRSVMLAVMTGGSVIIGVITMADSDDTIEGIVGNDVEVASCVEESN